MCGGRDFVDGPAVWTVLDALHKEDPIGSILQGGAPGADRLASIWASNRNVTCIECPADWQRHGAAAGPIRNAVMLRQEPDLVVAFPGGAGTRDMVKRAQRARIPVMQIEKAT